MPPMNGCGWKDHEAEQAVAEVEAADAGAHDGSPSTPNDAIGVAAPGARCGLSAWDDSRRRRVAMSSFASEAGASACARATWAPRRAPGAVGHEAGAAAAVAAALARHKPQRS